jgi:hypothetical protein
MNADGAVQKAEENVDVDGQARDMIYVRVRDDDIAHGVALGIGQSNSDASGIDGHAVVDEIAGQALLGGGAPSAIKGAG